MDLRGVGKLCWPRYVLFVRFVLLSGVEWSVG